MKVGGLDLHFSDYWWCGIFLHNVPIGSSKNEYFITKIYLPYVFGKYTIKQIFFYSQGFPGGSAVKTLPAMQEIWVRSLGQKDPLEKDMETHSSILAWRIPWTEEPGRLQYIGVVKLDTTEATEHAHSCNSTPSLGILLDILIVRVTL